MELITKDAIVSFSPAMMYGLVNDIESYPQFLDWCNEANVLETHEDGMTARLGIQLAGLRLAVVTRNTCCPDASITMNLMEGPFKRLAGQWCFVPLETTCSSEVRFHVEYEFKSRLLEKALNKPFHRIADTLVDRFVTRAFQLQKQL